MIYFWLIEHAEERDQRNLELQLTLPPPDAVDNGALEMEGSAWSAEAEMAQFYSTMGGSR